MFNHFNYNINQYTIIFIFIIIYHKIIKFLTKHLMQSKDIQMQNQLILKQITPLNYFYNWIELKTLSNNITRRVPFQKLKIFKKQKLTKNYQSSIYRLYLEKIYLLIYAIVTHSKLEISSKMYEKNGMLFCLYSLQPLIQNLNNVNTSHNRKFKGVEMIECYSNSNLVSNKNQFVELIRDGLINQFKQQIKRLQLNNIEEYQHWLFRICQILKEQDITILNFIQQFQKLPLTQHYIHKVRLQNALLSQIFDSSGFNTYEEREKEKQYRFQLRVQEEKKILNDLFNGEAKINEAFVALEKIFEELYLTLYNRGKIGTAEGPEFRKLKSYVKGKVIQKNFAIILSPYRVQTVTNEKKIETNNGIKDVKLWTKIQIKSKNGALQPISGNVIFVKLIWQVIPDQKKTFLQLHCCNNRKVQEMYYNQVADFWQKLEANEHFRNLCGIDKYFIQLNEQKQSMEVVFKNFVPNCILTNVLKQIDKIVALALSMDEVIELCQRKSLDKEGPDDLDIKPCMVGEVIQKFEWSLAKINKQSNHNQYHMA